MGRPKKPDHTVRQILETSQRLFLEKGYEQTTVQDIVDNLDGLSRGAIYHHFKSKEEIVDAVIRNMMLDGESFLNGNHERHEENYTALDKLKNMILASFQKARYFPQ